MKLDDRRQHQTSWDKHWLVEKCGRGVYRSAVACDRMCCRYDESMYLVGRQRRPGRELSTSFSFDENSVLSLSGQTYQRSLTGGKHYYDYHHRHSSYRSRSRAGDDESETASLATADYTVTTFNETAESKVVVVDDDSLLLSLTIREALDQAVARVRNNSNESGKSSSDLQRFIAVEGDKLMEEAKSPVNTDDGTRTGTLLQYDTNLQEEEKAEYTTLPDASTLLVHGEIENQLGIEAYELAEMKRKSRVPPRLSRNRTLDSYGGMTQYSRTPPTQTAILLHQPWKDPTALLSQVEQAASRNVSVMVSNAESTIYENIAVFHDEETEQEAEEKKNDDWEDSILDASVTTSPPQPLERLSSLISLASSFAAPSKNTAAGSTTISATTSYNTTSLTAAADNPVEVTEFEVSCTTLKQPPRSHNKRLSRSPVRKTSQRLIEI